MKNKINWLSRVGLPLPYYCLCLNEKQFNKVLKHLKVKDKPDFLKNDYCNATVHHFQFSGKLACVVCLGDTKDRHITEIYGLLIHESVHIYQEFLNFIGERQTGIETEAYLIQTISQNLIDQYINEINS